MKLRVPFSTGALNVGFHSPHPVLHLPVITGLTAAHDAGQIGTIGPAEENGAGTVGQGRCVARATPAVAEIGADIESGPVVDGSHNRRRLGIGASRQTTSTML